MSYRGPGYRGTGDRSRSPPRFADRRPSNASIFDGRHPGPPSRNPSDTRGPRGGLGSGAPPRTLRDAPPLGTTTDRARSFIRERDYPDRRERSPPPRERSPLRKFPEPRDFPPRDLDVRSARRASRDGPPSAGSNYSDNPSLSSFRGGFGRGRGRGDFFDRGSTRGGRRPLDDRADLFRRERSPPPRFGRDLSRDSRDADRRDERRFERREDERRPPEWIDRERDRERERELDRPRRDPPPGRLESRMSTESVPTNAAHQSSQPLPINPERLAILESSGADTSIRRPSSASVAQPKRELASETPAYLNGRAETTANRYGSRGSSPPTQAPPVPAFSFSVAPSAAAHQAGPPPKALHESRPASLTDERQMMDEQRPPVHDKPAPPSNAPTAPKAAPSAPKAHHASPPPSAPKAPRALEIESTSPSSNRLQGVRSLESPANPNSQSTSQPPAVPASPLSSRQSLPHLTSPHPPAVPRSADLSAPTGPKAARTSPAQVPASPRPAFASPRSDAGGFHFQRGQTPPPSAPSGPRNRPFSVSPKVQASAIPTAPKAARAAGPSRAGDRGLASQNRPPERPGAISQFAPPSGPRNPWNQWRRPGAPGYGDKPGPAVPAKRDLNGDEKDKQLAGGQPFTAEGSLSSSDVRSKMEDHDSAVTSFSAGQADRMDIDEPTRRRSNVNENQNHSARQSFFGKTIEKPDDDIPSSSEDDLSEDEDETLLEAKHAREERKLQEQIIDLGARKYRAISPLESIARLARLSVKDLERVAAQREDDMDVDDNATDAPVPVPGVVNTSESDEGPDIPTPQGDDAAGVTARDHEDGNEPIRHIRRPTPEVIRLPYLLKGEEVPPLRENQTFQETLKSLEEPGSEVIAVLEEQIEAEAEAEENTEMDFAEFYRLWRAECEALDKEKEEAERRRQQSTEPGPEFDAPLIASINPILEGRRLHKFSSEYEIEQVIKQSEETARIDQERHDREAKKVQADMEKEARLPDQQSQDVVARTLFIDANRLRDPEALTLVFSYLPPADNFTEKEQDIFIAAFKETPKKWGEIASLLPGRTYKDCIHHYYAFKWDNRFRDNRGKKFKGGRRGRGGKGSRPSRGSALMADLRGGEELVTTTDSVTGRPKRAAAPTTFGEREVESKSSLTNQSPAKKLGPGAKDASGDSTSEKPAKKARRNAGDSKPGRKAKTQLAALAAAPSTSPNKPFLAGVHTKEEIARAQHLEEASLLANLQSGQHTLTQPDAQMVFNQEGFTHMGDGPDRPKPSAPAAKSSASSYWSVPEQTDFFRYIEHFGTDFGAIASHMGTKTQTMIKNHYQRQIDGGRADLEDAARRANDRRERGEDIGPPPTPTPIVKRKYDNPQSNAPRAIAPHSEPMDTEEAMRPSHGALPKHASPPQAAYQAKPHYTTSAQSTPIPAQRVVPSPLPAASTPAPAPMPAAPHPRGGLQHPLGSRLGFLTSESRPSVQPPSPFRLGQEQATPAAVPRTQPPPPQPARTLSNVSIEYLNNLQQEQERALRKQAECEPEPRDIVQHQTAAHVPRNHGSPTNQPIPAPQQDRKPPIEERAPTPPRAGFPPIGSTRQPLFGPNAGPMHSFSTPLPPFAARGSFNQSPTKSDPLRPGSVPTSAPLPPPAHAPVPSATPAPAPTPAPEPPKRSNLLSILNSEPEEPKPPKRDSLPTPSRVASPGPASFPPTSAPQSMPGVQGSRREAFGQPSVPHSHFHRPSYSQTSSTPAPPPATLKHEPSSGGMPPMQQAPKQDWPPRMLGPGSHPSPPNPAPLERDSRPSFYQPHRTSMLGLGTPRAGPSPPPNALHSRTPSLSAQQQSAPPPRDQRPTLGGPQGGPHQSSQGLHSNLYGVQQYPPFSQAPSQMNRAHHSHNSSINDGMSMLPRMPGGSREEALRYEEETRADDERRMRQRYDAIHAVKQRVDPNHAQRMQEHEMERQRQQQQQEQAYGRGPMPAHPVHSSAFGSSPFSHPRLGISLRDQAARKAETAVQEQRRYQEEQECRRQQEQMPQQGYRDAPGDFRRRPEDPLFHQRRTTPYGGPPYAPPPPPGGRR